MGALNHFFLETPLDVRLNPCARQGPPGSSEGRSERFRMAMTGAASIRTAERHPLGPPHYPKRKRHDVPRAADDWPGT